MKMRIRFYFLLLFSTRLPIKVLVKADGYAQELELKSVEDSEVKTSEIGPKLIQSQIPSTSTSQDIFQSFLQLVKDQINNALSSSTNETSAVDSMEFNKELHEDDKPVQDQVEVPDKSYEVLSILDKLIAANNDDRSSAIEQPFKPSISANNLDVFEDEVKEESFPQLEKHGSNSFYVEDVAPLLPEGYHKANSDDGIEEVISRDQESPIVGGDIESKTSDEENQHKQPSNEDFKYGNTVNLHNDKGIEEMPNSLTGVLRSFGKVTTTTVDPIAALLSNIEIVDVSQYIPRGYVYSQELETFEQMFSFGPNSNINDLLEDEEFKKMKLNRKSKELDLDSYESNSNKVSSMKPGRLVGSQLAMMSKQLKRKQAEARNKAEEDLYLATFGGAQIETEDSQKSESKYGWRTEEEIDETDLSNLFESLLVNQNGPKEGSVAKETPSRPLVRPTTTMSTKPTTATTLRTTTLGVCGQFCGLFGSIGIRSGIPWSDNLNHPYTQEYKNLKEEFDKRCSLIFNRMYFGSSFEFCSVEAFTKRGDEMSVEVNLQFSGLVFNLTSTSILDSFTEELEVDGDEVHWMGEYVVNLRSSYFLVVDTELLNNAENLVFGIYGVEFPDWALLVLIAGIMLVFIIAMVGVITSVKRYNQSVEVKRRVLNVKTLKALRGGEHFDVVECGKYSLSVSLKEMF